jgi:hypothetical protein
LRKHKTLKILVILVVFLFFLLIIDGSSKYFRFLELNLRVAFLLLFLVVPGFYLLKLIRKKFFQNDIAFLLSIPFSILLYGAIFMVIHSLRAPPVIYFIFNLLLILLILFFSFIKGLSREILNIGKITKYGFILIYLGSVIALSFVHVNIENPRKEIDRSEIIARRGLEKLPVDNRLQYDTARSLADYEEPWRWETDWSWTMGDRPPLMGVLFSITALSTLKSLYTYWDYQVLGTLLNALFLLPLVFVAHRLFGNKKVSYYLIIIIFLNVFIFLNIYYTWPKLFSVFFLFVSVAILLEKRRSLTFAAISGGLWGLACLSHAGSLLSLPFLFLFYCIYIIKDRKAKAALHIISFLLAFVLFQLPWTIYKKNHPEINTQRLLYHYMPEEYYPEDFTQKEAFNALFRFYSEYPIKKQIAHRISNLSKIINSHYFSPTFDALFKGNWGKYFRNIYKKEFLFPITAIGEIPILLCFLVILFSLIKPLFQIVKKTPQNINIPLIVFFFSISLLGYIFNILIKWAPSHNHELPYFELIMAIVIVYGISFSFHQALRYFLLGLSFVHFLSYVLFTSTDLKYPVFDFFNVVVVGGVIAMILIANRMSTEDSFL